MTVAKLNTPSIDLTKVPPHSLEAEQSVIGSILLDNRSIDRVSDLITADSFYNRQHQEIFTAMLKLVAECKPIDMVTLPDCLPSELDAEDSFKYLGELQRNTPSAANVYRYAEIIKERYLLRELIAISYELEGASFHPEGKTAEQIAADIEQRLSSVAEKMQVANQDYSIQTALLKFTDYMESPLKQERVGWNKHGLY